VSADAMQVYRGLSVLTNQSARPAQLVGIWPLDREASVGEYARLAHVAIDEALAARRTPVVVGGTGLYLRAALADLDVPPAPAPGVRERVERLYDELGPSGAHAELELRDAAAAAGVHPNDRRRVVRALELVEAGASLRPAQNRLWGGPLRHPTLVVGLDVGRDELVRRIEARTRSMLERGALEEARRAASGGLSRTARAVIGLRELTELAPAEAEAAIVVRTRRYAAYQRKWMRRIPGLVRLPAERPVAEIAHDILTLVDERIAGCEDVRAGGDRHRPIV
jgi:tRNA dimethylallyltransferase